MSHEDSIADIVDTFVNYDIPTSPEMQWLNDMGFFMFTKYALRILRVVFRLLEEAPATALAGGLMQDILGDVSDIVDSNVVTNMGLNTPYLHPGRFVDSLTQMNSYTFFSELFD